MVFSVRDVSWLTKAVSPLKLIPIDSEVTANFSPHWFSLQASDMYPWIVAVVQISSSSFETYRCSDERMVGIDIDAFVSALQVGENDSMTMRVAHRGRTLRFIFTDPSGVGMQRMSEIRTLGYLPPTHREINEFYQFEYEVIIGIPSHEFRQVLAAPWDAEDRATAVVTNEDINIFTQNIEFLFSVEDEDCVIGGVGAADEIYVSFQMGFTESMVEASEHSDMVWLLWSPDAPVLLNCPVWPFGSIKYFFVQEWPSMYDDD